MTSWAGLARLLDKVTGRGDRELFIQITSDHPEAAVHDAALAHAWALAKELGFEGVKDGGVRKVDERPPATSPHAALPVTVDPGVDIKFSIHNGKVRLQNGAIDVEGSSIVANVPKLRGPGNREVLRAEYDRGFILMRDESGMPVSLSGAVTRMSKPYYFTLSTKLYVAKPDLKPHHILNGYEAGT